MNQIVALRASALDLFPRPDRRGDPREGRDVYVQSRRLWVRLHEKGGKMREMRCHHTPEECLDDYMEAEGLKDQSRTQLFRTIGRGTGVLSVRPMPQANAYDAMIPRRAEAADIDTAICCHTSRATGITSYLKNGRTLERRPAWPITARPARHNFMTGAVMR
jgi:hypothetical protein